MFVLILYRSSTDFPIIGPFKSSDAAFRHVASLPHPPPNGDWRIQMMAKPTLIKPKKLAKKAAKRKK